jgi:glycosyltransferase involved in cell wall biosynthesis
MTKILMSHPTGNSNVRAAISALNGAAMLAEFNTTIAINPTARWLDFISGSLKEQLLRRQFPLGPELLRKHPLREMSRIFLPKIGLSSFVRSECSWASIDSVYKSFDKNVASRLRAISGQNRVTAVYGYEDGALETFKEAKKLGLTCIYDLPIAYWETSRRLMQEEAERLPAWARTLGGGIHDSSEKLDRKTQELEMADVIIAPGAFVVNSIPNWAWKKQMVVAPFGSPESTARQNNQKPTSKLQKLRVLFVGSMSQRKGLGDLFAAVKLMNNPQIELYVMGSAMVPMEFYKGQLPTFTYLPNRPHHQVLELMRSCDVLCLPSIVEGRALVMQEAMSQGLPLIITANTGGADLIKEGSTGFLVPIRSAEAIAAKLNWLLENRFRVPEMGREAQIHAENYTWEAYGANIVSALSIYPN